MLLFYFDNLQLGRVKNGQFIRSRHINSIHWFHNLKTCQIFFSSFIPLVILSTIIIGNIFQSKYLTTRDVRYIKIVVKGKRERKGLLSFISYPEIGL